MYLKYLAKHLDRDKFDDEDDDSQSSTDGYRDDIDNKIKFSPGQREHVRKSNLKKKTKLKKEIKHYLANDPDEVKDVILLRNAKKEDKMFELIENKKEIDLKNQIEICKGEDQHDQNLKQVNMIMRNKAIEEFYFIHSKKIKVGQNIIQWLVTLEMIMIIIELTISALSSDVKRYLRLSIAILNVVAFITISVLGFKINPQLKYFLKEKLKLTLTLFLQVVSIVLLILINFDKETEDHVQSEHHIDYQLTSKSKA